MKLKRPNSWQELIATIDKDPWGKPYRIVMAKLRKRATSTEVMRERDVMDIVRNLFPNNYYERHDLDSDEDETWDRDLEVNGIQVKKAIQGKKGTATAPGPDGVTKKMWKIAPKELIDDVRNLYNKYLRTGTFPRIWKSARLLIIPKKRENDTALGERKFRPICLLNDIGKA